MYPIRSAIYIPTDHARAMQKAASLQADALIFDLEDGVSDAHKPAARKAMAEWSAHAAPTSQTKVLRINHQYTAHYADDIALAATLPLDGVMLSKVSNAHEIQRTISDLASAGRSDLPIWCNVETPSGYMNIQSISSQPCVAALVAGTNDLANDLRIIRTPDRAGLLHCLQMLVLAARAHGLLVLDGTFIDLEDDAGLQAEAQQGRMLGFDGKTLIHPKQIAIANASFSPTETELTQAKRLIATYEAAQKGGKAVTLLDGKMIEKLHYDRARQLLNNA